MADPYSVNIPAIFGRFHPGQRSSKQLPPRSEGRLRRQHRDAARHRYRRPRWHGQCHRAGAVVRAAAVRVDGGAGAKQWT